MTDRTPRPFLTLGVKPFLWADSAATGELQSIYFELSREHHPDFSSNLSDEKRIEAENKSAQLNSDYARLKDFWKLIELVLADAGSVSEGKSQLPPNLAMEYFDLQDEWGESRGTPQEAEFDSRARAFYRQVMDRLSELESGIKEIAKKFPYSGKSLPSESTKLPWSTEDVAQLQKIFGELKYFRSFVKDIREKFRL